MKERSGVLELCSSLLDNGRGHYEGVPVNEADEVSKADPGRHGHGGRTIIRYPLDRILW